MDEKVLAGCEGKKALKSFSEAEKRAKRLRRRDKSNVTPYRCKVCGKFHVGERG